MDDNTAKLIEQLANKLGTTSQYLWGILIRQAPIDATITLFQVIAIIVYGIVLYKLHIKFSRKKEGKYSEYTLYSENGDFLGFAMVIASILFIILTIAAFLSCGDIINGYFNPEYWALHEILKGKTK